MEIPSSGKQHLQTNNTVWWEISFQLPRYSQPAIVYDMAIHRHPSVPDTTSVRATLYEWDRIAEWLWQPLKPDCQQRERNNDSEGRATTEMIDRPTSPTAAALPVRECEPLSEALISIICRCITPLQPKSPTQPDWTARTDRAGDLPITYSAIVIALCPGSECYHSSDHMWLSSTGYVIAHVPKSSTWRRAPWQSFPAAP